MKLKTTIYHRVLHFRQPAGTSRGVYRERQVWYIVVQDADHPASFGVGECAPLPDLSCDNMEIYEDILQKACILLEERGEPDRELLSDFPSILFGLETALLHLTVGSIRLWNTPFSRGEEGLLINSLIWMGSYREMLRQIRDKIAQGYHCVKVKIGAINFEEELALLQFIRANFTAADIELRVDANGAFTPEEAPQKLRQLAAMDIHSIEQPIRAGQWQQMATLCRDTPLPVVLDEELIGIHRSGQKRELLNTILPHYIILKPTLHGGLSGCLEWINLAEERNIGWWITSALESNIELNALAQWCATLSVGIPQGLGTGMLYTDNIPFPLSLSGDKLFFHPQAGEPDLLIWLHT
ncbi:MAG: o-succinylbenzoate synthase [Bacteroides sp.]|nr:o-succinylbenzoate synthase [Bacteroides sp.]